jgi:hypothetical protein
VNTRPGHYRASLLSMPAAGMATKALRESIQPPLAIPTAPPRDTTEREHRDYPQPDRQNANPPRPEEDLAEQSEHSDHRRIENDSKGDRTDDAHAPTIARVLGRLTSGCIREHWPRRPFPSWRWDLGGVEGNVSDVLREPEDR